MISEGTKKIILKLLNKESRILAGRIAFYDDEPKFEMAKIKVEAQLGNICKAIGELMRLKEKDDKPNISKEEII